MPKKPYKLNDYYCKYIHRFCTQTRLEGYSYCIRHILQDKTAPFRRCSFVHPQNKKRCTNAAPKTDKRDSLCPWHYKRALISSKNASISKSKTMSGPMRLLKQMEKYCQIRKHNKDPALVKKAARDALLPETLGPKELEHTGLGQDGTFTQSYEALDLDEDAGYIDDEDDCLSHAGVYTAEEVLKISERKLDRLQSLYDNQFQILRHEYQERYKAYLHELEEKKNSGKFYIPKKIILHEASDYKKLKALKKYHRRSREEELLYQKEGKSIPRGTPETSTQGDDGSQSSNQSDLCTFSENGVRCSQKVLVLTKFCSNHILYDEKQVLFKSCNGDKNGKCDRPIIPYRENATCIYHMHLETSEVMEEVESEKTFSPSTEEDIILDPEHFQSMDDIASLGLDVITPGSLFGLDQFGEPGEPSEIEYSEDPSLMPLTIT